VTDKFYTPIPFYFSATSADVLALVPMAVVNDDGKATFFRLINSSFMILILYCYLSRLCGIIKNKYSPPPQPHKHFLTLWDMEKRIRVRELQLVFDQPPSKIMPLFCKRKIT
jgi:hypothetical protein